MLIFHVTVKDTWFSVAWLQLSHKGKQQNGLLAV
jgi:hypothetical protein